MAVALTPVGISVSSRNVAPFLRQRLTEFASGLSLHRGVTEHSFAA